MNFDRVLSSVLGVLNNRDISHTKKHFIKLIGSAKSQIHLVTGELDPAVFQDEFVKAAFAKVTARNNPVEVVILTGPNPDPQVVHDLVDSNEHIQMFQQAERPNVHFMVVDRSHVRVEEFHEPGTSERAAFVKYDTRFLADKLEAEFSRALHANETTPATSR